MKNLWPKAILLDFFGTVAQEDFTPELCRQISAASPSKPDFNEIISYWRTLYFQSCEQSVGERFQPQKELERVILQDILQHFHSDLDIDSITQSLFQSWTKPSLFPESRAVLSQCKIPICLVSNIDNNELKLALEFHNLTFDYIVTSDDCRSYKPNRAMFNKALALLGLSAREVLHVGDSLSGDVRGAKASGIPVLWVNRANGPIPEGDDKPDFTCHDLTGLLEITQRN